MKVAVGVCLALLAAMLVQAEEEVAPPGVPAGSRIINGRPATLRQFPYLAYIETFRGDGSLHDSCTGTLVTRTAVLTRAFWCVYGYSKWTVRLGSIYRTGDDPNAWTVESVMAMAHPKYDDRNEDNNIAIIHLPRLAPLNEFIQPVSLPSSTDNSSYLGSEAIVAGWGRTHPASGEPSDVLRWTKVVVSPNHYCKQFKPSWAVTDRHLCAGSSSATVHFWDYGAPLLLYTRGRYTLIGLYNRVTTDAFNTSHPVIYIRVASYIDWIKLNTESD